MQIQGIDPSQFMKLIPADLSAAANTAATAAATAAAGSAAGSSAASSSASTAAQIASTNSLGDESTFLQLLVAQIQNQDPTQPMDSSTFLTQLAEFSQVEQLIGIRQDVAQLDPPATGSTTSSTSAVSGS